MSEQRRATVMIIQRGDREIAGALMAGVIAGKAEALKDSLSVAAGKAEVDRATRTSSVSAEGAATFPIGEGFWKGNGKTADSLEVYSVQEDKWRRVARQVRIAVGNDRTAEDYRMLIAKSPAAAWPGWPRTSCGTAGKFLKSSTPAINWPRRPPSGIRISWRGRISMRGCGGGIDTWTGSRY